MQLSTNESQASTFLDQWEWTSLLQRKISLVKLSLTFQSLHAPLCLRLHWHHCGEGGLGLVNHLLHIRAGRSSQSLYWDLLLIRLGRVGLHLYQISTQLLETVLSVRICTIYYINGLSLIICCFLLNLLNLECGLPTDLLHDDEIEEVGCETDCSKAPGEWWGLRSVGNIWAKLNMKVVTEICGISSYM